MKKTLLIAAVLWNGFTFAQDFNVDAGQSTVNWKGANVVGKTHTGTLKLSDGKLTLKNGKLTGGSFVVDMTTLKNTDLSGEWSDKLVGHLKSDDFFSVETYKTSNFVITKVVENSGKYNVTGNITIKGKTETITFPADVKVNGNAVNATATLVVNRSKFDVRYGSDSFFDNLGDKAIADDIELQVALVAGK